jgi:hypothetical protein
MAISPSPFVPPPPNTPTVGMPDLMRMTGVEILTTYGPEVFHLVGELQGSGLVVRDGRSRHDLEITDQVRREIIAKEGDCRCGKIDCWKKELGIE